MTELQKFELVNKAETFDELAKAILEIAEDGEISGRSRLFQAKKMANHCTLEIFSVLPETLTRAYGIRQQAFYLKHYEKG